MTDSYPPFFSDCVGWPSDRMEALEALIDDADEVTLAEFAERIGKDQLRDLSARLGYATGLKEDGIRLEDDWHVSYRIHRDSGIPFMVHSAIEHVYASTGAIDLLQEEAEERIRIDMSGEDPQFNP